MTTNLLTPDYIELLLSCMDCTDRCLPIDQRTVDASKILAWINHEVIKNDTEANDAAMVHRLNSKSLNIGSARLGSFPNFSENTPSSNKPQKEPEVQEALIKKSIIDKITKNNKGTTNE